MFHAMVFEHDVIQFNITEHNGGAGSIALEVEVIVNGNQCSSV